MPALLIRHRVRDVDIWQRVFDDEIATRRAHGCRREHRFGVAADANDIWLLLEWDDLFRARLFVRSDDLRAALDRSGVIDEPDYWYLEEVPAVD